MPTVRVCINFNSTVTSPKEEPKNGTNKLPEDENYIFSIDFNDRENKTEENEEKLLDALKKLDEYSRWFHFECWREDRDIEKYARKAVFGNFKGDSSKKKFFIQKLTDNSQPTNSPSTTEEDNKLEATDAEPEAMGTKSKPKKKLLTAFESLESELKKMAESLGGKSGKKIKADISWHELDRSKLCQCFTVINKKESSVERHKRLQSLSEARPIGRVYFMYCFSLAEYFKHGEAINREFTEAETKAVERDIFKFYMGNACKLEGKKLKVKISKENNIAKTNHGEIKQRKMFVKVDAREMQLNNDGMDFSIFRTKLRNNNWLNNKIYRLKINATVEYFLRLSNIGLIEVRQEKRLLGEKNMSLAKILEGLIRFRRVDTKDERNYTDMPRELNSIVEEFAKYIIKGYRANKKGYRADKSKPVKNPIEYESKVEVEFEPKNENRVKAEIKGPKAETKKKDKDRRYVAIVLRDLKCGNKLSSKYPLFCELSIKPSDVHRNIEVVSSFLEGTMTYDEKSNVLQIPSRPSRTPDELPDLSSWSDEICFFESDRALIYFEPKTILESYNHVANYEAYWRAIVRGIEHQLCIRTCLQNMETTTTRITEQIPELLVGLDTSRDNAKQNESESAKYKLAKLASDVSEVIALLPKLRQISTTATAFRSGKAINKFDRLGRVCFQFPEMLRNIQQNVNELGDFLQYAKAQQLRIDINKQATEEKRRDDKLVRIGLLIAGSSIFYASFSFLSDAASFFKEYPALSYPFDGRMNGREGFFNSTGTKASFIYLALCLILGILIW